MRDTLALVGLICVLTTSASLLLGIGIWIRRTIEWRKRQRRIWNRIEDTLDRHESMFIEVEDIIRKAMESPNEEA